MQTGEQELKRLETGIDEMIRCCTRLKQENTQLRKQQASLIVERDSLLAKNAQAHSRVGLIMERLKALEHDA